MAPIFLVCRLFRFISITPFDSANLLLRLPLSHSFTYFYFSFIVYFSVFLPSLQSIYEVIGEVYFLLFSLLFIVSLLGFRSVFIGRWIVVYQRVIVLFTVFKHIQYETNERKK